MIVRFEQLKVGKSKHYVTPAELEKIKPEKLESWVNKLKSLYRIQEKPRTEIVLVTSRKVGKDGLTKLAELGVTIETADNLNIWGPRVEKYCRAHNVSLFSDSEGATV